MVIVIEFPELGTIYGGVSRFFETLRLLSTHYHIYYHYDYWLSRLL